VHQRVGSLRRGPIAIGAGFVLLALVGEWVGHAATWYLTGGASPGQALSGSMHTYLEPVGAALAAMALLVSWLVWRGVRHMARLARSTRAAIRRAWRADTVVEPELGRAGREPAAATGVAPARLWLALVVVQLLLYFFQENLEARAAGLAWPGLRVLTAHHGSALLIHAVVALAIAALAVEVIDRSIQRGQDAVRVVRLYRALIARRSGPVAPIAPIQVTTSSPRMRFGHALLSRPPPPAFAH
jgi:hypothetical protein